MRLRESMPELTGATSWINGEVTREQLVGEKPTLLHFWAVSCHLCKLGMTNINEFRDHYKDKLNVVSIHMPRKEEDMDEALILSLAHENGMIQPIFVDGEHKLSDAMENKYVPAYYVFDKEGRLRHFQAGSGGMKMLGKRINRVIDEMEK